jgi:O-acetyl-ADP-ribose deacetylase (regulator of RNase III)
MIEFKKGNILDEDADALVNTVNCVGIMGRGVALEFKHAFPGNFKAYQAACRREEVEPGRMFVFETGKLTSPRFIINFPTKRHWRGNSRMGDIESGLGALVEEIRSRGITSIAIPPLGSGLGGLRWPDVRARIVSALEALPDVMVTVYEPHDGTAINTRPAPKVPSMTRARAVLVGLMHRYLGGLLDPFVSLLELHKLMYFMQVAKEPLRLEFVKGHYGPYAENLRHVLHAIDGYFISGYGAGGDDPDKLIELVPGAIEDAEESLNRNAGLRERFERVSTLVDGFESSFGLELLATVHWVLAQEKPATEEELQSQVYAWAERKRRFTPEQIKLAHRVLLERGWVSA